MARVTTIIDVPYRVITPPRVNRTIDAAARQRAARLPQWLQDMDVDWIFREDAKRRAK
ncbi:MAG: hypothetical protein AAFW65_05715 [Pseudomonadota bacterium]